MYMRCKDDFVGANTHIDYFFMPFKLERAWFADQEE